MKQRILILIGLVGASLYLLGVGMDLFLLELAAKPVPVLCLILWLRAEPAGSYCRYRRRVLFGLAFSILGDLFMTKPEQLLIPAMGAFGLAHLCYVSAYVSAGNRVFPLRAIPFIIWLCLVHWKLAAGMGAMLVPVTLYMVLIGIMLWRAAALITAPYTFSAWIAPIGAVIFAVSDTMIAFHLFDGPFPGDRYLIILSYWAGQWLIAASAIHYCRRKREASPN